jgi:Lysyl oxidase
MRATVAVSVAVGMIALPSVAGANTLKPDLITRPLNQIKLCQEDPNVILKQDACTGSGRVVLRVTNRVANKGAGPLEFTADESQEPNDCLGNGDTGGMDDDVLVNQRLYVDDGDGAFDRTRDTNYRDHPAGCRYYHPEHDHYHLDRYARFLLKSERTGKQVRAGDKISFCISDSGAFDSLLPGAPTDSYYGIADCEQRDSITGTSVGWYDEYTWNLYGQTIDVTGLPEGRYCLIAKVDPTDELTEENESNNTRQVRLRINTADAPLPDSPPLSVSPLDSACRLGG